MDELLQRLNQTPTPTTAPLPSFQINQNVKFRPADAYTGYLSCVIRGVTWDAQQTSHLYILEWKAQETFLIAPEKFITAATHQIGDCVVLFPCQMNGLDQFTTVEVRNVWVHPDGEFSYDVGRPECVNESEILALDRKATD